MTPAKLLRKGPFPPRDPIGSLYLAETKVPLSRSGKHVIRLSLSLLFRVEPPDENAERWEIQTLGYTYLLFFVDREIAAYHWDHDAAGSGSVRSPHAHVGKELPHSAMLLEDRDRVSALSSAHMPTGTVPFTAILQTVIRDFGVEPLRFQGESMEEARVRAERAFSEAEAVLMASFDWNRRRAFAHSGD
jgi:hypothetical protein